MEHADDKPLILVVDDSRLMRVAARKILRDDFTILEAGDGEQAWESLREQPGVNLVMSDLSMPNLDGLGLLKRIREAETERLRQLPVIIVTGAEDDDGSRQKALAAGASDFITKPFESVQLLARAKAQATHQRTQQALQASEASKAQLEQHNQTDLLTGLPNARGFGNAIEESLSFARRHNTDLSLLMLRVEKYKALFLQYGKQTAERLLQDLARLLSDGRRREDVVARLELDTFALLLPSAGAQDARRIAAQVLARIQERQEEDNAQPAVDISIGVANPQLLPSVGPADLLATARNDLGVLSPQWIEAARSRESASRREPPPAPRPRIATAAELLSALQALSENRQPETDRDALVRAIVPLLRNWNEAHGGCCSALLEQLEARLQPPAVTPAERFPADSY